MAFGDTLLFENLDLTFAAGSWTVLLGPSGVGKTTLLRMVAGLVAHGPDVAVACDDGRPLAGRMAWMGQQDLLLPWLGVLDNVLLGSRLRGQQAPRDRAIALLGAVGLDRNLEDRPARSEEHTSELKSLMRKS